eukprot:3423772-Rhodomonas_salina.1
MSTDMPGVTHCLGVAEMWSVVGSGQNQPASLNFQHLTTLNACSSNRHTWHRGANGDCVEVEQTCAHTARICQHGD